ncbi:MAG: vWA domain-containing protein [Verrucomicrobiales bacterium]
MNDELKVKLTAWALDELPAEERKRLETEWENAPEARQYAAQTKDFCSLIGNALSATGDAALTDDQRARLTHQLAEAEAEGPKVVPFKVRRLVLSLSAAAAVIVAAIFAAELLLRDTRHRRAADASGMATAPEVIGGAETLAWTDRIRPDSPASVDGTDSRAESAVWQRGAVPPRVAPTAGSSEDLAQRPSDRDQSKLWSYYDVRENLGLRGIAPNPEQPSNEPPTEFTQPDSKSTALAFGATILEDKTVAENGFGRPPSDYLSRVAGGRSDDLDLREVLVAENEKETAALAAAKPERTSEAKLQLGDIVSESDRARSKTDESASRLFAAATPAAATESAPAAPSGRALTTSLALAKEEAGKVVAGTDGLEKDSKKMAASDAGAGTAGGIALAQSRMRRLSERERLVPPTPAAGAVPSQVRFTEEQVDGLKVAGGEARRPQDLDRYYDRYYFYKDTSRPDPNNEAYVEAPENGFKSVAAEPLSTFSIDVDTASYANVRRFLNQGQRPPREAVRLEEMVNYFSYDYPQPEGARPFSVTVDVADCPWQQAHRIARIGLKGREITNEKRGPSNLVFLVDVSGSMEPSDRLPLVKQSLRLLVERLTSSDRISMVTYAGNSGLALDATTGDKKQQIMQAIDALAAGGSTHGSAGIQQAYEIAAKNFVKEGVNRVILATDGDFNVGITDRDQLLKLITDKAKTGVFLSVLGYGMGNLKDATMEMLADKGNGNYAYIDGLGEARKVLAEEMNSTLVTIAKDVKIQIEFNPVLVRSYRLLGYDNRMLAREDFNDDKKDAGEIGAGHTVTALYELVPVGAPPHPASIDPLKYQPPALTPAPLELKINPAHSRETMTVKLRYKAPESEKSELLEVPVVDQETKFAEAPADFKFAASVAAFGMLLKDSPHKGEANWEIVRRLALEGKAGDPLGYRGEFIQLVDKAQGLTK